MAEIKTGIFAKNVQKRLSRAQEKVLQKLGKADETKDEQFEQCVQNFKRQESEGSRLQREMRAYLTAVKAMQQASINLTESLHEVYEPDWHGKDDVMTIGKDCDALWEDFHQKLVDSTIITLDNYLQQFPDLKIRVAKRSRKLIDFDSARHHLETLQASTMRNDRKIVKAEDELKKAQKVFDELNVGLQDELPTLWDSRVGFYVNTFKSVTHIEAKFHREISLLCKQLYEVMTKLGEQHSDKMFTIQGAPSDSGPLRLARTPSPPSDDSPPDSPVASPNHSLRPVSPGPPRPKSPSQLRKGPPVPPPPKVTPTKELHQEQIINLFGDEFLPPPAMSPSLPNERPGESLMDMDFDPFTPNTPMGQPVSPVGQALPWDMWTANVEPAQPGGDSGFVADWAADFGPTPENGDSVPAAAEAAARQAPTAGQEEAQDGAQSWHQADGWGGDTGEAAVAAQPQESEAASGDEVTNNAFNGFSQDSSAPAFFADFDKMNESTGVPATAATEADVDTITAVATEAAEGAAACEAEAGPEAVAEAVPEAVAEATPEAAPEAVPEARPEAAPEVRPEAAPEAAPEARPEAAPEARPESAPEARPEAAPETGPETAEGQEPAASTEEAEETKSSTAPKEKTPASPVESPDEPAATEGAEQAEVLPVEEAETPPPNEEVPLECVANPEERKEAPLEEAPEKMPIPSVVIEPASSNEGDDDRDGDIISPTTISDNGVAPDNQPAKDISSSGGFPLDFMYKVETLHDFEAANSDELELKKGDIVLVVPTALAEDQDAGWLTGMKESEWSQLGADAHKGLFPENFTQRLD
ncbi:amphiphysin [Osmerus mordax]|uniref:amphiphysin n=1 Tax=Osmerus mordax TaxID=8014 RepID=UPI00350EFE55